MVGSSGGTKQVAELVMTALNVHARNVPNAESKSMGMAERRLSTPLRKLRQRRAPLRRLAGVDQRADLPTGTVTFMFTDIWTIDEAVAYVLESA